MPELMFESTEPLLKLFNNFHFFESRYSAAINTSMV